MQELVQEYEAGVYARLSQNERRSELLSSRTQTTSRTSQPYRYVNEEVLRGRPVTPRPVASAAEERRQDWSPPARAATFIPNVPHSRVSTPDRTQQQYSGSGSN